MRLRFALATSVIAGVVLLASGNVASADTTMATYQFSYESSFQSWSARTEQNTGTPVCGPYSAMVSRSTARAKDGSYSLDFTVTSPHDCGLVWVQRRIYVGTTAPRTVDMSVWLYTEDFTIGTGGQNRVEAYAGAACPTDPDLVDGVWTPFTNLGSTGHDEGPGWYNYQHHTTATPSASGYLCFAYGLSLPSTFSDPKHYYFDLVTISVT